MRGNRTGGMLITPRTRRFVLRHLAIAAGLTTIFAMAPVLAANSDYQIAVVYPADDQAIRENTGAVSVRVSVSPGLHSSHQVEIRLDGRVVLSGRGSSVSLTNVDRGLHAVSGVLIDETGTVISRSSAVTFHMLRVAKGKT